MTIRNLAEIAPSNIGIVELIVMALWINLLHLPKLLKDSFDNALFEKKYQSLHRIYTAARYTEDFDDKFPGILGGYTNKFDPLPPILN